MEYVQPTCGGGAVRHRGWPFSILAAIDQKVWSLLVIVIVNVHDATAIVLDVVILVVVVVVFVYHRCGKDVRGPLEFA